MKSKRTTTKPFNLKRSLKKTGSGGNSKQKSTLQSDQKEYTWSTSMERVSIAREGIPFGSIEYVSHRLNLPIKSILSYIGMPQTTYNKKKSESAFMESRDSELILMINELIDYGQEVFNGDQTKFLRWFQKTNLSLGGVSPETLLDTITGIDEVRYALDRIESGNFA